MREATCQKKIFLELGGSWRQSQMPRASRKPKVYFPPVEPLKGHIIAKPSFGLSICFNSPQKQAVLSEKSDVPCTPSKVLIEHQRCISS